MVCRWENAQYLGAEMKPLAEELKVMASDAQVRLGSRPAQACYCWMERAHRWGLVLAACQAMRAQLRGKPADRDDTQRRLVLARALSVEVPEEVALSLLLEAEDKDRAPTVPAAGLKDFLDRAASKVRDPHARSSQPCPYFWFRLLWGMVVTPASPFLGVVQVSGSEMELVNADPHVEALKARWAKAKDLLARTKKVRRQAGEQSGRPSSR